MTVLFLDSFDHYGDLAQKYDSYQYALISSGSGRYGTAGAHIWYGSGSSPGYIAKVFSGEYQTLTAGFAWTLTASRNAVVSPVHIVEFYIDYYISQSVSVNLGRDNELYIISGAGSTSIGASTRRAVANKPYYFEFSVSCDQTAGAVSVWLNGTRWINLTGINTSPAPYYGDFFNAVKLHAGGEPNIDDLYVSDSGTPLEDVRIFTLYPSADGSSLQWTPSSGTAHYSLVNESPPVTTGYVSSTGSLKDLYGFDDFDHGTGAAKVVQLNHLLASASSTAGTLDVYGTLSSGSTSYTTAAQSLSGAATTYVYKTFTLDNDPLTGKEWTLDDINSYQYGIT